MKPKTQTIHTWSTEHKRSHPAQSTKRIYARPKTLVVTAPAHKNALTRILED